MEYAEFEIPATIATHVQCIWRMRDEAPGGHTETIYPDGRCELIVHLGAPMARLELDGGWREQAPLLFAGQFTTAIRLQPRGPVDCVGIRVHPAASAGMAGGAIAGLREQVVDLTRVDAAFGQRLAVAVRAFAAGDPKALHGLLRERVGQAPLDSTVVDSVERIDEALGQLPLARLAEAIGIPPRTLQARFLEHVGLTAKQYSRVIRLQATIRALDDDSNGLAQIAAAQGFSDQAHATRELGRITGLTPKRLRDALRDAREQDGTLRLAAAFVRGGAQSE